MPDGAWHTVRQGECVDSVAYANGHFWETLWQDPENRDLKTERRDPNILKAGDRLWVPAMRPEEVSRAVDARHRFRRKGVPAMFRARFMFNGRPRADIPFDAVVDNRHVAEGCTTCEGVVEFPIMPDAALVTVTLRPDDLPPESINFDLGAVEPIDTLRGVQQRLRNLGIECQETDDLDDATTDAIRTLQGRFGLAVNGELTDDLRDRLKKEHGS